MGPKTMKESENIVDPGHSRSAARLVAPYNLNPRLQTTRDRLWIGGHWSNRNPRQTTTTVGTDYLGNGKSLARCASADNCLTPTLTTIAAGLCIDSGGNSWFSARPAAARNSGYRLKATKKNLRAAEHRNGWLPAHPDDY